MAPKLLSSTNFKSLFDSVDTFLFDCDGIDSVFFPLFTLFHSSLWWGMVMIQVLYGRVIRSSMASLKLSTYSDPRRERETSLSHSSSFQPLSIWFWSWFCYAFQGKNIVFVTNNSMKSRRQYAEKFRSLGLTSVTQVWFFSYCVCCLDRVSCVFEIYLCVCVLIERKRYFLRLLRQLCTSKPTTSPRTRRFLSS